MANEGESVVAFVFGWAFLFIAALGAAVLTFPLVATSLSFNQWLPAECDQPLVSWILGILAAFAYSMLFLCFHQLTGHPEKDRCTCVAKLCNCAVGLFLIGSAVIGTLWHSWAEDCSQELKDFVSWALLYLYGGVPVLLCSYWALVCFGTAALSAPADVPGSKGEPALHPTMPRPTLRRGTARELLRRSFAQPARTTRAVPLCSRCSRLLQQSEVEAVRGVDGPKLCGSCLLDSEQRLGEAERHTQLVRQFEESQRWQHTTHRQVAEHHAKVEADLEQLRADTASQEAVVELQGYLDTVARQLRRQGRKQVVALLSAFPSAVESLIQVIFTKWRLLVRRLGPFAVGHLLAQKQRRLEAAKAEEQLLRLFAAWCNVTSCAGPTTDQRPRPDDNAAVALEAAPSSPPAAVADRSPSAERERPAAAVEEAPASSGGAPGPRARGPGEPARALRLTVVGATGLRRNLGQMASESFCVCEVPGRPSLRFQTPVINNTLDPVWNHEVDIPSFGDREWLAFTVYIQNSNGAPDAVGTLALAAGELRQAGFDGEIPLVSAGWEIGQAQLRLWVPRAAAEDTVDAAVIARSVPGAEVAGGAPPATSADASVEAAVVRPAPRLEWTDEALRAVSVDGSTEEDPVDESAAAMVISMRPPELGSVDETSTAAAVGEGALVGASRPSRELDSAEGEVPGVTVQLASPASETSSSAGSVSEPSVFGLDQATASSTAADGTRHGQPDMEEADLEGRTSVLDGPLLSAAEDIPQPLADVDDPQQQPCAIAKCCPIGQDEEDLDGSVDEAMHHQPAIAVAGESQDPEPLVAAAEEASQPQPSVAADEEVNDSWPPVAATEEAGQSQPIMVVIEEFEDPQLHVAAVEEARQPQPLVAATEETENPQLPVASVGEARQLQPLVAATEDVKDLQPPVAAVQETRQPRPPIEEAEDPQSPAAAVHQTCQFQPLIEEAKDPQNPAAAVQETRQPPPHIEEAEDSQLPAAAVQEPSQSIEEAEDPQSSPAAVHQTCQFQPFIEEAEDPQNPAAAVQEASQPRPHTEEAEDPQSPTSAVPEARQPNEEAKDPESPGVAVQEASQPRPHIEEAEDPQSPAAAVQEASQPLPHIEEAEDSQLHAAAVQEARRLIKEAEDPESPAAAVLEASLPQQPIEEAEDPHAPAAVVEEAGQPRPHIEEAEDPQTSVADVRDVKDVQIAANQEDGHPAPLKAANPFTPVVPGMPTLPVLAAPRIPAVPGPRRGGPPGRRGPGAATARAAVAGPSCGGGAAAAEAAASALPKESPDTSAAPAAPVKPAEPASSEKFREEKSQLQGRLGALGMASLAAHAFWNAAKASEASGIASPSSDSTEETDLGDAAHQPSEATALASPARPDVQKVAGTTEASIDDASEDNASVSIEAAKKSAPGRFTGRIGWGTDTNSQSTEASVGLPGGSMAASTGEEISRLQGRPGALGMSSLAAQTFLDAAKEAEVSGIACPSSDSTEENDLGDAACQPSGAAALASPGSPDFWKVAAASEAIIDDAGEDSTGDSMKTAKRSAPSGLSGRIDGGADTNSQSTEASVALPGGSMATGAGEDDGRPKGRLGALAMASFAGQAFADASKEPDTDSSVASAADSPEVSCLDDVGDQRSGVLAMASLAGQAFREVARAGKASTDCSGIDNSSTLAEEEHGQTLHQDSAFAWGGHGAIKPMLHGPDAAGAGVNAFDDDSASSTASSADSYAKPIDCALDGAVEQAGSPSAAAPVVHGEAKAPPGQSSGAWSTAPCAGRTFMEHAGNAEGSAGEFVEQADHGQRTACPAETSEPTSDSEMSRAKAPSLEPVAVQLTAHTAEPNVVAAEEDARMRFMEMDSESSSSSDESS